MNLEGENDVSCRILNKFLIEMRKCNAVDKMSFIWPGEKNGWAVMGIPEGDDGTNVATQTPFILRDNIIYRWNGKGYGTTLRILYWVGERASYS